MMADHATLSIITAIKPARLSKGFALGAGGDLLKSPGGNLVQGNVETRTLATLADLAAILTPDGAETRLELFETGLVAARPMRDFAQALRCARDIRAKAWGQQ